MHLTSYDKYLKISSDKISERIYWLPFASFMGHKSRKAQNWQKDYERGLERGSERDH
jgi:hypothetical protein